MALPSGILTATITFGKTFDVFGQNASVSVQVNPSNRLLWAATGDYLANFTATSTAEAGVVGQFLLPRDQPGFRDAAGDEIRGWFYTAFITETINNQSTQYRKVFTITEGQTLIDLDTLPIDAVVMPPGSAPIPPVTSVNGETGDVSVEGATSESVAAVIVEDGPAKTALTEAIAGEVDSATGLDTRAQAAVDTAISGIDVARKSDFQNVDDGLFSIPTVSAAADKYVIEAIDYAPDSNLNAQNTTETPAVIAVRPTTSPLGVFAITADGQSFRAIPGTSGLTTLDVVVGRALGVVRTKIRSLPAVGSNQNFGALMAATFASGDVKFLRWLPSGTTRNYVLQKWVGTALTSANASTNLVATTVQAQAGDIVEMVLADPGDGSHVLSLIVNGTEIAAHTLSTSDWALFSGGTRAGVYGTGSVAAGAFERWAWADELPSTPRLAVTVGDDRRLPGNVLLPDGAVDGTLTAQLENPQSLLSRGISAAQVTPFYTGANHPQIRRLVDGPVLSADAVGVQTGVNVSSFRLVVDGDSISLGGGTDHEEAFSKFGIWLAHSVDGNPAGPYVSAGIVFRDEVLGVTPEESRAARGDQTENPFWLWDEYNNEWILSYSQRGVPGARGAQSTLYATAPTLNSTNWQRQGILLQKDRDSDAGDGQTTYAQYFDMAGQHCVYALYGGDNPSKIGLWRARGTRRKFERDPAVITSQQSMFQGVFDLSTLRAPVSSGAGGTSNETASYSSPFTWKAINGSPVLWRGAPWWIGTAGPRAVGGALQYARIIAAPLRADMHGLSGPPVDITPTPQAWEGGGVSGFGNIVPYRGMNLAPYAAADGTKVGIVEVY